MRPSAITISWKRQPAKGSPSLEEGEGADVAQRLGDDALVEDEAAAVVAGDEALGGQPALQVGVGEHLLARGPRGGTAAGTQSQSASKWQSRVSVSRLAGSPQRGHATSTKSGRSASGLPSPVGSMSRGRTTGRSSLGHRHRRRSSRSGRSGSACPRSAGGRSRSRRRGSASPRGRLRPAPRRAVRRRASAATPRHARGDRRVGLVDGGDAERRGRPEAGVDERRDEDRQLARRRAPVSEAPVSTTGTAAASRALRSQPPERSSSSCSRTSASPTQALDLGVARREQDEAWPAPTASACGVKTVSVAAVGPVEVELDPVAAAEDVALGGERELVPVLELSSQVARRSPPGRA